MQTKRLEFLLEARSPISHHQETFGNVSILMRQKVRLPDGRWAKVPIVSGDTMRHGLREAAAYCLLECAGMLSDTLSESALRLLFAGGMVTGGSGGAIKLDEFRELVELVPPLALLGGCAQNRVIPGQIQVEPALLVCRETAHLLPSWVPAWVAERGALELDSARSHVEEVQRVRMDPLLDPGKRKLLIEQAREEVQRQLLASETASETGDAVAKDDAKSSMMPRRYEQVAQGSLFYWAITATTYSDLDIDSLMVMVGAFLRGAKVGGKRGTGNGHLVPLCARHVDLATWQERSESLELSGARVGDLFRQHVTQRAEKIKSFLGAVVA